MSSSEYGLPAGSLRGCQRQQDNSTLRLPVGLTAEWWCCFDVGLASLPLAGGLHSDQPSPSHFCDASDLPSDAVQYTVMFACLALHGGIWQWLASYLLAAARCSVHCCCCRCCRCFTWLHRATKLQHGTTAIDRARCHTHVTWSLLQGL